MKILITGPTSGTGKFMASQLAKKHELVLLGRDQERMSRLQDELQSNNLHTVLVDLADYKAVLHASEHVAEAHPDIDIFISNAGILGNEQPVMNKEGMEVTFMTNYLAHYLLLSSVGRHLRNNKGSIFNICSQSHDWYRLDFQDLQSIRKYQPMKAYGRSKRMLLLLGRKTAESGIRTYSIAPGTFRSGIARSRGRFFQLLYNLAAFGMRSPANAVEDVLTLIDNEVNPLPPGELIRKGKVVEIEYSAEEIGKLMEVTKSITGIDLESNLTGEL